MSSMNKAVIILGVSLILLAGAEAVADDPVMIRIYNDDAESVDLSVYDLNAQPPDAAIVNQRVNGFAWIPISVTAGRVGKGHVKWTARTVDPSYPSLRGHYAPYLIARLTNFHKNLPHDTTNGFIMGSVAQTLDDESIQAIAAVALVVSPLLREKFKSERRLDEWRLELKLLVEANSAGGLDSARYAAQRAAISEAL